MFGLKQNVRNKQMLSHFVSSTILIDKFACDPHVTTNNLVTSVHNVHCFEMVSEKIKIPK